VLERFGSVSDRFITQVTFDAASSALKEYGPNIHRITFQKQY
jgi:hypothetical protein